VAFTGVFLTTMAPTTVARVAVNDSYDELVYQGSAGHSEAGSNW
jgi:hypothetical protein